jgi:glutaredoxin
MVQVKVYGADWCKDTQHALQFLDGLGVEFDYVNIDHDAAARDWVRQQNSGRESKPTIRIGQTVLRNPNDSELATALRSAALIASE